eukprot:CAMPEP_0119366990 /NCGR_PEP_ID=MMETSP1334-20130426/13809_1 /TAXON_ID=127549 /ORGANISM="Calcidiscus leptoporus, Strain RCC1130" /LENGTH=88 /DNA_ID=CAMNT_0007383303 /DNA_START=158 /DNA_END=421 /DNA_ORIENTATION=+
MCLVTLDSRLFAAIACDFPGAQRRRTECEHTPEQLILRNKEALRPGDPRQLGGDTATRQALTASSGTHVAPHNDPNRRSSPCSPPHPH